MLRPLRSHAFARAWGTLVMNNDRPHIAVEVSDEQCINRDNANILQIHGKYGRIYYTHYYLGKVQSSVIMVYCSQQIDYIQDLAKRNEAQRTLYNNKIQGNSQSCPPHTTTTRRPSCSRQSRRQTECHQKSTFTQRLNLPGGLRIESLQPSRGRRTQLVPISHRTDVRRLSILHSRRGRSHLLPSTRRPCRTRRPTAPDQSIPRSCAHSRPRCHPAWIDA